MLSSSHTELPHLLPATSDPIIGGKNREVMTHPRAGGEGFEVSCSNHLRNDKKETQNDREEKQV